MVLTAERASFALLNLSRRWGYCVYDAKYTYNLWWPVRAYFGLPILTTTLKQRRCRRADFLFSRRTVSHST